MVKKILKFLILITIFILIINTALSIGGETGEPTYSPQFWSSPQNYPSASASDVKFGLEKGYISDDNLKLLNAQQLENNLDLIDDWSKLDQKELSKIVSDKTNKDVDVVLPAESTGMINDNGFSFPAASSFSIDDTSFSSPNIINYNNNVIYVKSADNVVVKESVLNKIKEYYGGEDIFKTNAFDGLLILSDGTPVKYNSLEKDSEISLSNNDVVILKKGVLDDGQHIVISNSTEPAIVTYEKGKIRCALIAPSTYILEDNEFYAIYEPADGVNFNMCFKNFPEQVIEMGDCINCGLFDFIEDVYTLNGFIQFQKKPTLVAKNNGDGLIDHAKDTEDYFIPLFDGKADVTAMFYDIAYLDEFILSTLEPNYLSYTNPANYLRIKEENGRTYLNKADLLNSIISTPFLTNYIFNEHPAVMEGQIFVYDNLRVYPAGSEMLKEVFN